MTEVYRRFIVAVRSNNGTYKLCSSSLPKGRPDLSKLGLSRTIFAFLVAEALLFLLSNQRSFNLSTALPSTIDLEEQPLISLYAILPSILDYYNTTLDQSFHRIAFNLSLKATSIISVFPQYWPPFPREHV